ncbi:hypothetical protein QVD17_03718 [Tagetes erecta]|uniref:Uncharacterized protein n=1 Tax=Tagetes erecta TaxID=13708 RepID=A0AAD8LE31_TARER|nr:hypothetical protein QVD17_03718 [Tagetes erecta]
MLHLIVPQHVRNTNLNLFIKSGYKEAFVSYACQKLGSNRTRKSCFSLAATKNINCTRTTKSVVGDNNEGVILLCVLRRSRSSHIWRLRRVSVGLSLDYG